MKENNLKNVEKRFEELADEYDQEFIKLIPKYIESIDALINSIPFEENAKIRVLDLGCGTGVITKHIKEIYENSIVTCIDLSEKMIEIAKKNLKEYKNIDYLVGNFLDYDFKKGYDLVVSSLAIHHLVSDEDKKRLYKNIYEILNNNGVFYNNDKVQPPNEHIGKLYHDIFIKNLKNNYNDKINEISQSADDHDYPSQLFDQLKWLEEIGFKNIEVIWKYYGHGVYGGEKIDK
ncbi:MAG: class I SAM-dependent methyltransferase [Methanobrevibacter sp.]|jgi:tRNA (cmo5U34)-methyltransferase|nr:class I SAM-dependent methyltransferase [Candidatus Methanoflexus mossambicus]